MTNPVDKDKDKAPEKETHKVATEADARPAAPGRPGWAFRGRRPKAS